MCCEKTKLEVQAWNYQVSSIFSKECSDILTFQSSSCKKKTVRLAPTSQQDAGHIPKAVVGVVGSTDTGKTTLASFFVCGVIPKGKLPFEQEGRIR